MRQTLTIDTVVVVKEGISAANKAWTLSNVTDTNGKKYSTFESLHEGKTYEVEVVKENSTKLNPKSGKPYVNNKITKIYPMAGNSVQAPTIAPHVKEMLDLIRENNQMLKDLTIGLAEEAEELPEIEKLPF